MKNNNYNLKIAPPPIIEQKQNEESDKQKLRNAVNLQWLAMMEFKDEEVTYANKDKLENLLLATEDLINNCMENTSYFGNRDQNFTNLIFIHAKLNLKYETYKTQIKLKEIQQEQEKLEEKYQRAEEKNNNLVYNLLGFLTAFSIVSSVVGVVSQIEGTLKIMLFMAFTILILLTTLIALHNFYKNNNERRNILQNNYFLWGAIAIIVVVLVLALIVIDNKDNLYNYIDNRIERVIEKGLTLKIEL